VRPTARTARIPAPSALLTTTAVRRSHVCALACGAYLLILQVVAWDAVAGGLCTGSRVSDPTEAGADVEPSGLDWCEAMQLAVARSPAVAAARARLRQQSDLSEVARTGYRPRVQAGITAGEQGEYGFGQVARVGITQLVYDFGKTSSAVSREAAAEERERAAALVAVDTVMERTLQALVEVHRHQSLESISEEQLAALGKVYEITRLRADAGATQRSDPVQARARLEAARAQRLALEMQRRQWLRRLQTYLGPRGLNRVAAAPDAMVRLDPETLAIEEPDSLPSVRVAAADWARAVAELKHARAQGYPTLSLEVNMNQRLGAAGARYREIYGKDTYGSAYLSLDAPLYQGGEISARRRAGAAAVEAALAEREVALLDAAERIETQRQQVDGLYAKLDLLASRVDDVARTRSLYWDQYLALGTRTALDLLNVEQELTLARQDLTNTRHDLWNALAMLLVATGQARDQFAIADPVAVLSR